MKSKKEAKMQGFGNVISIKLFVIFVILFSMFSFTAYSQRRVDGFDGPPEPQPEVQPATIENGQIVADSYNVECSLPFESKGACGTTCTKTQTITTDSCTLGIRIVRIDLDDEGSTSTDTGYYWSYNGCSCNCKEEKGNGCSGTRFPSDSNVPFTRNSPVTVTVNARNDCKASGYNIWGNIVAYYVLEKVKCNEGFRCDASSPPSSTSTQNKFVTLCRDANFGGTCKNYQSSTSSLSEIGGVSSIKLSEGLSAALCYRANVIVGFRCKLLTTDDSNLEDDDINDKTTALQILDGATLCRDNIEDGTTCENFFENDQDLVDNTIGDDNAKYIYLAPGYSATLCEHNNYNGNCQTFTTSTPIPKPLRTLLGFSSKVSSIQVIKTENTAAPTIRCVPACKSTETLCGNNCVDIKTDDNNCGICGKKCNDNQKCVNSQCVCSPEKANPNPTTGDITYSDCSNTEWLYDGTSWTECNNEFWKEEIGDDKREYLCAGTGRQSIYECYGEDTFKSGPDGKRLKIGESVTTSDGITYYCHESKKFVTNLDTSNSQKTCKAAKLNWTGSKCCSEADDNACTLPFTSSGCPSEYSGCLLQNAEGCTERIEHYNEPARGATGGCWKSEFIKNNFFAVNFSVINYNGTFHGCKITNQFLLSLKDTHTQDALITNHQPCSNAPVENFYCSYQGTWNLTNGLDKTHLSFAPVPTAPELKAECCKADQCWNGSICIDNQKTNPLANIFGNGIRCINGDWVQSTLKHTADGTKSGYCPKESQCLIDPQATNPLEQCAENGNYTNDDYCENGNWSSRTKLLALKLLKIKNEIGSADFAILCDSKKNTLNFIQYTVGTGTSSVANILETDLQTNNFCVLSTADKIIIGTSINQNLERVLSKNLFGIKSCSNTDAFKEDSQYHFCNSGNNIWLNKKLKSFIYSKNGVNIPPEQEQPSFIRNLIRNIINIIKEVITPIQPDTKIDDSFVKGIKKFDRLYLTHQSGKSISASIEGIGANNKNAVFEYKGLNFDICNMIKQFNETKKQDEQAHFSGIACKKEGNDYYILAQGSELTNIKPDAIWLDLTSKLRLR